MSYLKKNKKVISFLFIVLICVISNVIFFNSFLIEGHDTLFHMNRISGALDALRDHQFLPKVYPYANRGFGYGSPMFYSDLFVLPFSILYYLKFSLVNCYKLMIITYSSLTVISVFYLSSKVFKKEYSPYLVTILYTFCNYHIYDYYFRQACGEIFALLFIPWVLYAIYLILVEKKNSWLLLGTSFSLLLLSHMLSFALYCVLFLVFIICFVIINRNQKNAIKSAAITTVKGVVLALGLSAFHLFPMLEQMLSQTFYTSYFGFMYDLKKTALSLSMLLFPFCKLEGLRNSTGYYAFNLGWIYLFIPMYYFILIFKKKGNAIIHILSIISVVCILFTLGLIPFLNQFSFLNTLQFSYRFNLVAFPLLTIVIGYILEKTNKLLRCVLSGLIICYSLINCIGFQINLVNSTDIKKISSDSSHEELYSIENAQKMGFDYNWCELSGAEYLPPTDFTNYLTETTALKEIGEDGLFNEILVSDESGDTHYLYYERSGSHITFEYENDNSILIMLPQTYYKGYAVKAINEEGKSTDLEVISVERYKQVGFNTLEGKYTYISYYKGTNVQHISLFISLFSIFIICGFQINRMIKKGR